MRLLILIFLAMGVCLAVPASADEDPKKLALASLSEMAKLQEQLDTLYRVSEELVFWQSIAIMGADHGWEYNYSLNGTDIQKYTLRLYNALDESENDAVRAIQTIRRSKTVDENTLSTAEELYTLHLDLRSAGQEILTLLRAGNTADAATIFQSRVLEQRRRVAGLSYSAQSQIRSDARKIALKARYAK